jgi:hypothetical protein
MRNRFHVSELVSEWFKSRSDNRSEDDLLGWIIQAFWAGELGLYPSGSDEGTSRETFLRGLREVAAGSEIVFSETEAEPEEQASAEDPEQFEYEYIDETLVAVPAAAADWSPEIMARAYAVLAVAPVHHYPRPFLTAFRSHEVKRQEFATLCDRRGWERPSFWFLPEERKRPLHRDHECRAWLATVVQGPRRTKESCAKEARERFGTPRLRFDRMWKDMAPGPWRSRGRFKGNPDR